ncbi:hypothetical protein KM043_002363 [Ampulex compressa]|nr:hypothetical protein KM043_002363 [Ampulex compressa]
MINLHRSDFLFTLIQKRRTADLKQFARSSRWILKSTRVPRKICRRPSRSSSPGKSGEKLEGGIVEAALCDLFVIMRGGSVLKPGQDPESPVEKREIAGIVYSGCNIAQARGIIDLAAVF